MRILRGSTSEARWDAAMLRVRSTWPKANQSPSLRQQGGEEKTVHRPLPPLLNDPPKWGDEFRARSATSDTLRVSNHSRCFVDDERSENETQRSGVAGTIWSGFMVRTEQNEVESTPLQTRPLDVQILHSVRSPYLSSSYPTETSTGFSTPASPSAATVSSSGTPTKIDS